MRSSLPAERCVLAAPGVEFVRRWPVGPKLPHAAVRLSGEGKGGIAGFAKGGADVKLVEDGADTVLTYDVKAQVGGKLAQLGSRLIDSTSKKLAGQFFTKFNEVVSAKAAGV